MSENKNTDDFLDDLEGDAGTQPVSAIAKPAAAKPGVKINGKLKKVALSDVDRSIMEKITSSIEMPDELDIEEIFTTQIIEYNAIPNSAKYAPVIRENILVANTKAYISSFKSTKKITIFVTGKHIKYWKKSKSFNVNIRGLIIHPDDKSIKGAALLVGTFDNAEQVKFVENCDLYRQYKVSVAISKDAEINYTRSYDKPQLLILNQASQFNNPISQASTQPMATIYKQVYGMDMKTCIEPLEGREEVACGISNLQEGSSQYADENDLKVLIAMAASSHRTFGTNSLGFRATSLIDPNEDISCWAYDTPEFKKFDRNLHAVVLVGSIAKNANSDYGKYSMNLVAMDIIPLEMVGDLL